MHVQGFRCRVRINNSIFAVSRYSVSEETPDLDVSNSEGYSGIAAVGNVPFAAVNPIAANLYTNSTYGQAKATIELEQATLITNALANPFALPFTLTAQIWVKVEIMPDRANPTFRHFFPSALVLAVSQAGQVTALQPVTIRLVSDGPYSLYTNSAQLDGQTDAS